MNKNEKAWEVLFEEHQILSAVESEGKFFISSDSINKYRESRLMTKFDHLANLPKVFRENGLSILPTSRGTYAIGRFDAYASQTFAKDLPTEEYQFPSGVESINPNNIYSEAAAINSAFISGMIDEIAGEDVVPTLSGKMGTSKFGFKIRNTDTDKYQQITVENSQCEIDGGFEGQNSLVIIEAKNAISEDFIVRQLYYPYRLWRGKISKKVIPVFLSYSNDIFHFFVYEFQNDDDYNSIRLVRQRNFTFAPEKISLEDIQLALDQVRLVPEPIVPFPQADKFERIVDLLSLLANGSLEAAAITENYDFDSRQTQYYTSAGRYLGLLEGDARSYSLSKRGSVSMKLSFKPKYLSLVRAILSHEVFNKTCRAYLEDAQRPPLDKILDIMRNSHLNSVGSHSTYTRRARTVISWVDWILNLQK